MIALGERFEAGVHAVIDAHGAAVARRHGSAAAPSTASAPSRRATAARPRPAIDAGARPLIHLCALNRGVLLTPFHNMALMSPATTEADVDRHTEVFAGVAAAIAAA